MDDGMVVQHLHIHLSISFTLHDKPAVKYYCPPPTLDSQVYIPKVFVSMLPTCPHTSSSSSLSQGESSNSSPAVLEISVMCKPQDRKHTLAEARNHSTVVKESWDSPPSTMRTLCTYTYHLGCEGTRSQISYRRDFPQFQVSNRHMYLGIQTFSNL